MFSTQALADKFKELEQQQAEVQRSLEEALMTEQERGRGLDKELTDERAQSAQLCTENTLLQEQLSAIRREVSGGIMAVLVSYCPATGVVCAWSSGGGSEEAAGGGRSERRGRETVPAAPTAA